MLIISTGHIGKTIAFQYARNSQQTTTDYNRLLARTVVHRLPRHEGVEIKRGEQERVRAEPVYVKATVVDDKKDLQNLIYRPHLSNKLCREAQWGKANPLDEHARRRHGIELSLHSERLDDSADLSRPAQDTT